MELLKSTAMRPDEGEWTERHTNGERTARIRCPGCGEFGSLENHEIAADGSVSPSVVCPTDCGFHELVKLENW